MTTIGEGPHTITLVNPSDKDWTDHRYILAFDAYGSTRLMVWANSLDSALDECIDWIVDNAPGLLCDEQVTEEYNEAIAEGLTEEQAYERATQDTTIGGNAGNHIPSWEWSIVAEDPSRDTMLTLLGRENMRKNIAEVIAAFAIHHAKYAARTNVSCSTDGTTLYSYAEPIASWTEDSFVALHTPARMSKTTTLQMRAVKLALQDRLLHPCTLDHEDCRLYGRDIALACNASRSKAAA